MILMFGGMFVIMYFFMIRPQQKKAETRKIISNRYKTWWPSCNNIWNSRKINEIYDDAVVIETEQVKSIEKASISRELTVGCYAKTTDKVEKAVEEKTNYKVNIYLTECRRNYSSAFF